MPPLLLVILRRAARPALISAALMAVVIAGGIVGARLLRAVMSPPLPGAPAVASRLREVQDLATTQVVLRTIQRGAARADGLIITNTDEILCRLLVTGDYGFDLAAIGPDRVRVSAQRIRITLPPPHLLAPGFSVAPAEILDTRTTRWLSDTGPGQLSAVQAARVHALVEAPRRIAELGIDREIRDTTRLALKRVLPAMLGYPTLSVTVDFDDETEVELPAPPMPPMPPMPPVPPVPGGKG